MTERMRRSSFGREARGESGPESMFWERSRTERRARLGNVVAGKGPESELAERLREMRLLAGSIRSGMGPKRRLREASTKSKDCEEKSEAGRFPES